MRLLIALVLIVASEVAIRVIDHAMGSPIARPMQRPLGDLPLTLGAWTGEELQLDPKVFVASGAVDVTSRSYQNPTGDRINLFLGTWLEYPTSIPHSPELCYPSNGWEITNRTPLHVPVADDHSFMGRLLSLDQHGQRIAVLYWFYLGSDVALEDNDVRRALQTSRRSGNPRPPMIKVMLQTDLNDPAQTERRLVEFAEVLAHEMRELVQ